MAGTYTYLLYHIVFSTKGREPVITSPIRQKLYDYIEGIIRGERGTPLAVGGVPDHVHLVVRLRAEPSLATMVKTIKAKSSGWLNKLPQRPGRFAWQVGYGAFTVSKSQLGPVLTYANNQEAHHRRKSFQEEFRALFDRHGIEYDERYLWD